jgi:activator of Hsp90 ATPase-like protein
MVNFEPAPGGTRLVLVQQRFETNQARDNHNRGWSASFDRLAKIAG